MIIKKIYLEILYFYFLQNFKLKILMNIVFIIMKIVKFYLSLFYPLKL